jgi:glycogen debranching enzyme
MTIDMDPTRLLQPLLHDTVVCVSAPTSVIGDVGGQLRAAGVHGVLQSDRRTLSEAVLLVGGREPEALTATLDGPSSAVFVGLARTLGDEGPDPTVRVERRRTARLSGLVETIRIVSTAAVAVRTQVVLRLASDGAHLEDVKMGKPVDLGPDPTVDGSRLGWVHVGVEVWITAEGAVGHVGPDGATLTWDVDLAPRGATTLTWNVNSVVPAAATTAPVRRLLGSRPAVSADDVRAAPWLDRSLDDIEALCASTPEVAGEAFVAAGAPWYLALFGRDSLWSARMLLPTGTDAAESTLRVLAGLQGQRDDGTTAEAPGKILHELRATRDDGYVTGEWHLPPRYYGTIDATMLWVVLLHDAWRWGLPPERVESLLDACEAALGWIAGPADSDGDGFCEYEDRSGSGLSNQGWKDSADSVRFRDGTIAKAPIALCEVQGYAHEALVHGADLLEAFGRPGFDRFRVRADGLATSFRNTFWVEDSAGPYPALALDEGKRPVDSLTSNIGHLLGTGLLSPEESVLVARRLVDPDLDSGYGLRTMAASSGGYSPLSYHCGSVWPHDTAIAVMGLSRAGLGFEAASLIRGLLVAAESFDYRLPELYAGDSDVDVSRPVPYPASCRPQAWAAASAVAALTTIVGVDPDVPAGQLRVSAMRPSPIGALRLTGLTVAGGALDIEIDRDGVVVAVNAPPGLVIDVA